MESDSDDYHNVLVLWESIWTCSAARKQLMELKAQNEEKARAEVTVSDANASGSSFESISKSASSPILSTNGISMKELSAAAEDNELADALKTSVCLIEDTGEQARDQSSNKSTTGDNQSNDDDCDTNKATYGSDSSLNRHIQSLIGGGSHSKLTDPQLYGLCICLAIIRRERDLVMANRYDVTNILKVGGKGQSLLS